VARTIPATLTPVDPSTLLTGEPLRATSVAALGAAVNWSLAHVARAPVIAQAWAETAGSVPCARTSPVPATVAEWTIPELEGGSVVSVVVIARVRSGVAGSSHSVTVQSVNGADSFTVNATSGLDATWKAYTGTLDVAWVLSRETVRLRLAGATNAIEVASLLVYWPALASLPAGTTTDGRTAVDDGELVADRPLSARVGSQIYATIDALGALPRVHVNVSDLRNVELANQDRLPPYAHQWLSPRFIDSADRAFDVLARVVASSAAAGEVIVQHSGGAGGFSSATIEFGAVSVRDAKTEELRRTDRAGAYAQDLSVQWQAVRVWPQPDPATWDTVPTAMSTVDAVHGLLLWSFS
jgi:hypothetical protein